MDMGFGVEVRLDRRCPGILGNKDHLLMSVLGQAGWEEMRRVHGERALWLCHPFPG